MDADHLLDQLDRNAAQLAGAARRDLAAAVPPCPGWTVKDVVEHVAEVYEHKIACMQQQAMPDPWPPPWPAERDPLEWFSDALGRLRSELVTRGPQAPSPTWWPPDQTVGFWLRRMAQETAVHRVDVESAFRSITPVDDELAVDGVDELLECFLSGDWSEAPSGSDTKVIGVQTGGRRWRVRLESEHVEVERSDDATGAGVTDAEVTDAGVTDAEVAGAPSDVLLWLWGRLPDGAVEIAGDQAALRVFRRRLTAATQ